MTAPATVPGGVDALTATDSVADALSANAVAADVLAAPLDRREVWKPDTETEVAARESLLALMAGSVNGSANVALAGACAWTQQSRAARASRPAAMRASRRDSERNIASNRSADAHGWRAGSADYTEYTDASDKADGRGSSRAL